MAEEEEVTEVEAQLSHESIKLIAESVGVPSSGLSDEAINLLIDDGTYRLKDLAQVALGFVYIVVDSIYKIQYINVRLMWIC